MPHKGIKLENKKLYNEFITERQLKMIVENNIKVYKIEEDIPELEVDDNIKKGFLNNCSIL